MMLGRASRLSLSRRVVASSLMFGLAAVIWLLIGVLFAARSVFAAESQPAEGLWWGIASVAEHAPVAFLCPVLLVVFGAVVLCRMVQPVADIERQLERAATAPSISESGLEPVEGPAPVETGWNRLVRFLNQGQSAGSLDARLGKALEGYRHHKSEHILNSLPDGVAVTAEDGRISFANAALVSLLGMGTAGQTLHGKTVEQCLGVEASGGPAGQLLDPKLRARTLVVEIVRSDGASQRTLRVARSPLRSAEAGAGGFVWSIRDVTQQKLADQMRDQFLNAATHELRTPMANIKAYAETLALGDVVDVEQQKMFCNIINEEVTRLARFVDDLLHLSRMEVGATALKRQVTDMERLLREAADKVRGQMEQKDIEFEVALPGKLPELVVDKEKLTVALVNLLGNAAKYTPAGGRVRLHVELANDAVQVHVEDTGVGISVEEVPKVFEKFFRSSDPRVLDQTGSGLGLSLAHEIVRLHGGKLTVHSELNKGSTFTAILPISPG